MAYPAALPARPQLTSSAYEPVSVPGAATSSSSALVVIPWTAPAAPVDRASPAAWLGCSRRKAPGRHRQRLTRTEPRPAARQGAGAKPASIGEAAQEVADRACRAEHPGQGGCSKGNRHRGDRDAGIARRPGRCPGCRRSAFAFPGSARGESAGTRLPGQAPGWGRHPTPGRRREREQDAAAPGQACCSQYRRSRSAEQQQPGNQDRPKDCGRREAHRGQRIPRHPETRVCDEVRPQGTHAAWRAGMVAHRPITARLIERPGWPLWPVTRTKPTKDERQATLTVSSTVVCPRRTIKPAPAPRGESNIGTQQRADDQPGFTRKKQCRAVSRKPAIRPTRPPPTKLTISGRSAPGVRAAWA